MIDRYAVFGHPVAHSRSPDIHAAFARQTGERLSYERIEASPDGFAAALDTFFAAGGRGCNVTVPFKAEAFALAARRDPYALRAEAVNTLWRDADGLLHGANTDGPGLLRDLQVNLGWPLAGRALLVIGAGGASAGILGPLLDSGPARLRACSPGGKGTSAGLAAPPGPRGASPWRTWQPYCQSTKWCSSRLSV